MIDTAIILAAGRGSRLKQVTATRSKGLVPIAGRPLIGRVIDALQDSGISKFLVVRAPHDEELAQFCSAIPGAVSVVQPQPLGSGHALQQCAALAPESFLVCACDSLIPSSDISRLIAAHDARAVATLSIIEVPADTSLGSRSVVTMSGDAVLDFIEKPAPEERLSNLSSLPLYILSRDIFPELATLTPSARGEIELPQAFRSLIKKGRLVNGVLASERFDLTDQNDLLSLTRLFLDSQEPAVQIHHSVVVPASATIVPPVLIEECVAIAEGVTIGPSVYIEHGATIEQGCSLEYAVVLRGARASGEVSKQVVS